MHISTENIDIELFSKTGNGSLFWDTLYLYSGALESPMQAVVLFWLMLRGNIFALHTNKHVEH